MIAGQLEVVMLANVARLQNDMNQAKGVVTNATAHIERAVSSAKTALASLGITLGIGAFAAMIKGSIDAADHLNDLSKSTALTVEQLAGLSIAAKQSGSDLDGVASSITKLAQNMGKDAEKFKAAGITARDPLEAFKQLADLFVAIEDPQTRAALGAATLGKNWATAAPLLAEGGAAIGEMVDKGTRLSGVTAELAKQSDAFNDKLVLLTGTNSIMNSVTGQLLPLLNKLAGDMVEAKEQSSGMNSGFTILLDTFKLAVILGGMVAKTFQAIGTAAGAQAAQLAALARADFSGAMLIRKEALADLAKMPGDFLKWRDSILAVGTAAQVAASKLDGMDQVSRRMASQAAAAARAESEAAAKRAQGLIGGGGGTKTVDEYEKIVKAADKFVESLKKEADQLGLTAIQKKMMDAATVALTLKTDAERMAVMKAAKAWADAMAAQEEATAKARAAVEANAATEKRATEITAAYIKELEDLAAQRAEMAAYVSASMSAADASIASTQRLIEQIRFETTLIGKSNVERQVAIATRAMEAQGVKVQETYMQNFIATLRAALVEEEKTITANNKLKNQAREMADAWRNAGADIASALSKAFGTAGTAAGGMVKAYADGIAQRVALDDYYAQQRAAKGADLAAIEDEQQRANAINSVRTYGDMAAAAAGFFDKSSDGYKALMGISQAFHAAEVALQIASIAPKLMAGAAAMFGQSGWGGFAGVAAMGAVMAGLGYSMANAGSEPGQSGASRQQEQGTGTVLGDADAKSQSLLNAIKEIEKTDKIGLTYSHDMLEALRAIQSSMGALASLIFRTSGVTTGGDFGVQTGTLSRNTGDPLLGMLGINDSFLTRLDPILGGFVSALQGLWGRTTQEITDAGVLISGTVGQLMRGQGISQYANVTTNTSSWFGLVNDTSNSTLTAGVSDRLSQQFALIFGQIIDSIESAAKALDMWSPKFAADLRAFVVEIDKISLQGLKGQELQDALNSVFSTFADQVSLAFFGTGEMQDLAKAGEGFYETLIRVATGNEYVKQTFAALGLYLPLVGMAAVTARMDLIDLVGGLESFGKLTQDYYSKYYTPAEQQANLGANLGAEFGRLGVAMPTDTDGFRRMVEGIDLGTEAGRKLWAEMMKLAPSFYDFATQVVGLDGALHSLDEVTAQHMSLEEEYAVLTGTKTAQFVERSHRMAEAIDATSLATLQAIFAEEDRQAGLANQARQNDARFDLEKQLFDLSHSEAEILEHNRSLKMTELALKEQELGMAPGTLQAIQRQIDAQTDLNAAREAEKAALKTTSDLEGRLGVLRGDYTQKELDRAREWQGAANDTDRALLTQIYAQEDLAEATRNTTEALDKAKSSQQSMWERFATDAQKAERATRIVNEGFAALGIAVPQSGEAFANLIDQIDATTPAGQALLAALELIAPSFDTITSAALTMIGTLYGATPAGAAPPGAVWVTLPDGTGYWMVPPGAGGAGGTDAANIARQRRQLEIELMEALGHAEEALAAKRADILADLDASLRDLQQQVWDALDAQKLREAAKAWSGVLNDWLNGNALGDLSPMTAQQQLLEAQRQYDLAKLGGDAGALTAAADMLLAADKAVEGFGGGYSALYAQIRADLGGLAESGPAATVGEAQIVTAVGELRQEVADAKRETARLLERLIEATRDGTVKVSGAVNTGTTKTAAATEKAAAVNERK